MSHYKETNFFGGFLSAVKGFFGSIYRSYIPNRNDNIKQILLKLLFLVSLVGVIVSAMVISSHFLTAKSQRDIINESRQIWSQTVVETGNKEDYNSKAKRLLYEQNSDFVGWVKISDTQIDNPVYKAKNDSYYINHNQNKEKSRYGAIFAHCENALSWTEMDKNIVLFGHNMKDGAMFGELKKLRKLNFLKEHPTVEFTTLYTKNDVYKIYAVFLLNSKKQDDGGRVYNIYKNSFANKSEFDAWYNEALERSFFDTGVNVNMDDEFLTMVTCASDFPDARLVVMARKLRPAEDPTVDATKIVLNKYPRYPKKWYDIKGQKYPFS